MSHPYGGQHHSPPSNNAPGGYPPQGRGRRDRSPSDYSGADEQYPSHHGSGLDYDARSPQYGRPPANQPPPYGQPAPTQRAPYEYGQPHHGQGNDYGQPAYGSPNDRARRDGGRSGRRDQHHGWNPGDDETAVIHSYRADDYADDYDDEPEGDDDERNGKRKTKAQRRKRRRKILLISLIVFTVLIAGATGTGLWYLQSFDNNISRTDAFEGLNEAERPVKEPTKAMNFLILGSDSRDPELSGSRADTIMIAHVTADHSAAQIVSIPRDSWVPIPKSADGKNGGKDGKINWAYSWGGLPLMIKTVESFTKVRIDHVVIIDFAGFKYVVDSLGGIDVQNDVTFTNWFNPSYTFKKGKIHLNGDLALEYARNRKTLPDGDFGRVRHQQLVVKAVLDKATSSGTIANPGKLTSFLEAIGKTITTDKGFELISTAMDLKGITGQNIQFMTCPNKGTGMVGDQSVVKVDPVRAQALFAKLKEDKATPEDAADPSAKPSAAAG